MGCIWRMEDPGVQNQNGNAFRKLFMAQGTRQKETFQRAISKVEIGKALI